MVEWIVDMDDILDITSKRFEEIDDKLRLQVAALGARADRIDHRLIKTDEDFDRLRVNLERSNHIMTMRYLEIKDMINEIMNEVGSRFDINEVTIERLDKSMTHHDSRISRLEKKIA